MESAKLRAEYLQWESAGQFLPRGGEMGARIRSHDWSRTPLGPPELWPQSLKTALSILLDSGYPMYIAWGPEFIQFYNDAYRPILGSTKHPGALGQSTPDCFAEIWDFIGPMFQRVMREGENTTLADQLLPLDRNGFVEECYFTFSYSAIRDESGGPGGVLVTVIETTDRVVGERRLKTLKDLAQSARGHSDAEVAAHVETALRGNPHDFPFALLYWCDGSGSPGELAAAAGVDPGHPVALCALQCLSNGLGELDEGLRNGQPSLLDCTNIPEVQGSACPEPVTRMAVVRVAQPGLDTPAGFLIAGISPRRAFDTAYQGFLQTAAGQIGTSLAEARAYLHEKRRAEELAELDRAKTTFFSNVSHEFRTPLTLLLGPLEELLARHPDQLDAGGRQLVSMAHRSGLRLSKLVNTLLDFARIEAGRERAAFELVDLSALTAEIASTFRSTMEKAGLMFNVDCPPLPELFYVDREMWEKIVLNFLSNAFKFTFAGSITVELRSSGAGDAELRVRDTGAGIAPDHLPHVFDRFYRVEGSHGRSFEGAGIGLALVAELVKLHGGSVRAESRLGEGSTFIAVIPRGDRRVRDARASADATRPSLAKPFVDEAEQWAGHDDARTPNNVREGRILVADDNADMRRYLRHLLGTRYHLVETTNGLEALGSAMDCPPDLVLTDVMMPEMDGIELLRSLRSDPRTANVPIVMLSARAGEEARVEGLAAGADDYLVKPFTAAELIARVDAHLKLHRKREEADHAVRESEEMLRLVTDSVPALIAYITPDLRYRFANHAYQDWFGIPPAQVVGRHLSEVLGAAALEALRPYHDRVLAGHPVSAGLLLTYSTGPRHVHISYTPDVDASGVVRGYTALVEDTTERVKTGEERKRDADRLRLALDAARMIAWQWIPGDAALLTAGRTESIFGAPVNTIDEMLSLVHPDCREDYRRRLWDVAANGGSYTAEFRIEPPATRNTVWLEERVSATCSETGIVQNVVGLSIDISERKHAEAALKESEERFHNLADNSPVMVWVTEPDGRCSFLNRRWCEFTGQSAESGRGYGWLDCVHPDDREQAEAAVNEANRRRKPFRVEYRLRRHDGEWRWAIDQAAPRISPAGDWLGFVGSVIDITERRTIEEALRASEEQFRSLANAIPQLAWMADANGWIFWYNSRWYEYTGATPEEMDGWGWQSVHDPNLLPEVLRRWRSSLDAGQPFDMTFPLRAADGSFHPFLTRAVPVCDSQGKVIRWFGTNTDVSDQARLIDALRESEERFRAMADNAPVMIWVTGSDRKGAWFNRLRLEFTGRTMEQEQNDCWTETVHPDDLQRTVQTYVESFDARRPFVMEYRLRRHDGLYRWVLDHGAPRYGYDGEFQGYTGSCLDIHDRREMEEALRRANADLEQFAYSASHDLQEPIRNVAVYSELIRRRYTPQLDDDGVKFLGYLTTSARRLDSLVKDLLSYTRAGMLDEEPVEPTAAAEALQHALANLERAIQKSGATVTSGELPSVPMRDVHLQQLFQNLIGNAIKYRSERLPLVHVSAARAGDHWRFDVADNGIGLDPEYKDLIFGLFKRLHRDENYEGTGIGLAICQRLVEAYGGRISVESTPGQGSTFSFTVPAA
jgi:PAS domain S-box-containing protein